MIEVMGMAVIIASPSLSFKLYGDADSPTAD
jgi:hypothetical protein